MKFRQIHVNGFGMLSETGIKELPDGLILVEGANGAGKSTFREFVISLLFGYGRGWTSKYASTRGALRGGKATLQLNNDVNVLWSREYVKSAIGDCAAIVEGQPVEATEVLGSANRVLYESVFALDLDQLRNDALDADRRGAVEAAITGMDTRGLPNAIAATQKQIDKLQRRIRDLRAELDNAKEALNAAKEPTRRYDTTVAERNAAEAHAEQLAQQLPEAENESQRLARLVNAWEPWCRYRLAKDQAARLEELPKLHPDDLPKLRQLVEDQKRIDRLLREDRLALIAAEEALNSVSVDERILGQAEQIEGISGSLDSVRTAEALRLNLAAAAENANRHLKSKIAEVGEDWDEGRLHQVAVSFAITNEGSRLSKAVSDAQSQLLRHREELAASIATKSEVDQDLALLLGELEAMGPAPTPEELARRAKELEAIREDLTRLDLLRAKKEGLDLAGGSWDSPTTGRGSHKKVYAVAAFILVMGAIVSVAVGGKNAWLFGAFGAFVSLALVILAHQGLLGPAPNATKASGEQQAAELKRLEGAIQQVQQRIDSAAAAQGWEGAVDLGRIHAELSKLTSLAARRSGNEDRLREGQTRAARAETAVQRAKTQVEADEELVRSADAEWRRWCATHGYPSDLEPAAIDSFIRLLSEARNAELAKQSADEALAQNRVILADIQRRLAAISEACGRLAPEHELADAIVSLARALKEANEASAVRQQRESAFEACRKAMDARLEESTTNSCEIAAILSSASVESPDEYERVFEDWRTAAQAQATLEQALELLTYASGPGEPLEKMLADLAEQTDFAALSRSADQALANYQEISERAAEAKDAARKLAIQVQFLESGADLGKALAAQAEIASELDQAHAEWAECALVKILLNRAREEYQTNVQEAVLERASTYMRLLTGGEIEHLDRTQEGFSLRDRDGEPRNVSQLNRSQAERLLLAVRLGYIDHYCDRRESLPIILDDVLVNFDAEHQKWAVETIFELASRHQVIYLTCHSAPRDLLDAAGRPYHLVRLTDWKFETTTTSRPRARRTPPSQGSAQPLLLLSE